MNIEVLQGSHRDYFEDALPEASVISLLPNCVQAG